MEEKDEDFSIDPEPEQARYGAGEEAIKKLREKLKSAEGKAQEYLDGWQRERADFANLRKRDEEAKSEFLKFANTGLVEDLLPVLDALNLAMSHGERGVEQTHNLMLSVLKKYNLEELDPKGEQFDPSRHEAVGTAPVEREEDDHKILEVMQKGYILSGRIIRPAKVKIGQRS